MKKLLLLFALLACSLGAYAQLSQSVATLYHEGELNSYYGMDAFKKAYDAAADNDIITLSSGSFTSCKIEKSITVRGAGCDADSVYNGNPTYLIGDFSIVSPRNDAGTTINVNVEGVYIGYKVTLDQYINLTINKCIVKDISHPTYDAFKGKINLVNTRVKGSCDLELYGTAELYNCIIRNLQNSTNCYLSAYNCVIYLLGTYSLGFYLDNASLNKCILFTEDTPEAYIKNSCFLTNNIAFSVAGGLFKNSSSDTNKVYPVEDVSKYMEASSLDCSSDTETYRILDKSIFTVTTTEGTDLIGIHGGIMPWATVPSNPQITKFDVDKKSTAAGTLNVTIQVGK